MAPIEPPVPADANLQDFGFMPLNVVQLSNSDTWAMASGWAAKACINLWMRAWHQVPAGSLPNNEDVIAMWSGIPRDQWESVRDFAMRGFVLATDGRLYHEKLCEKVMESWEKKRQYRDFQEDQSERGKKGAQARWGKGKNKSDNDGDRHSGGHMPDDGQRHDEENGLKGEGQLSKKKDSSSSGDDLSRALEMYQVVADRVGLPRVAVFSDVRKRKLRARLKNNGGMEAWELALKKIEASDFCSGRKAGSNWCADFDFMLQESKYIKLLEGGYDNREGGGDGGGFDPDKVRRNVLGQ